MKAAMLRTLALALANMTMRVTSAGHKVGVVYKSTLVGKCLFVVVECTFTYSVCSVVRIVCAHTSIKRFSSQGDVT